MSIWILAFVLCALFGALGFVSGAIRTALLWFGVVVACVITSLVAPALTNIMPKVGIQHPIWIKIAPYIIVFSLLALVVYGVGFGVHHKVALKYKYQSDDFTRLRWESMNKHVGLSLGLVVAVIVFFVISKAAYAGGYLTAQVAEDKNNPFWINFLTDARSDMQSTGLDRSIAAIDKTSSRFYDTADIIGLIYNNPILQGRLANYPDFLALGQNPDLQEIGNDKEYNDLIYGKASFGAIINHADTKRILGNQELLDQLKTIDLKDLETYLRTGKSPKYEEEKLIGRWILDKDSIITAERKAKPDMKADELLSLRKGVESLPDYTLIAMPGNKALVKSEGGAAAAAAPANTPAPAPAAPPPQDRYAQFRRQQPARPVRRTAAPAVQASPVLKISGEGEWKPKGVGDYEIALPDADGKPQTLVANFHDDELVVSKGPLILFFNHAQ